MKKQESIKEKMSYILLMAVATILFVATVIFLENNLISLLGSSFLALVSALVMLYAGMKLDVFAFTEGSCLAKVNTVVNAESDVAQRNSYAVNRQQNYASYASAEIVDYRQKRIQQRRFEEIAYTIKAVS